MIVLMEQTIICTILAILGLCLGSFAGASVWRLRAGQLKEDKASGEKVDAREYKKLVQLTETTLSTDRSRCLHCSHALKWYDLIPLISWASTGGKCRYCKKRIGYFEPIIELSVAFIFVASYLLWPNQIHSTIEIMHFALWLIACVMLAILFAYDIRWYLLPNRIIFPLIAVSIVVAILSIIGSLDAGAIAISTLIATAILSGLYLILWLISKGEWIGFGDVKLGLALALLLADWQLAFIALFAANLIGCLLVIPGMLMGKITRKTRVPFGPLLIAGAVIAMLVGGRIVETYFSTLL
jgi:prepilin signal peptidase PulO-like enzyme (type II secretory pathway)